MTTSRLLGQYGRLSEVPTDIQYSIFLNAPADTLDDLCENDLFFQWCHNDRALLAYVSHNFPRLLNRPDGSIIAILKFKSKLLSNYLLDQYIHRPFVPVKPEDKHLAFYVTPPIREFAATRIFTYLNFGTPERPLRFNDLLLIITEYGIATEPIIGNLVSLYKDTHKITEADDGCYYVRLSTGEVRRASELDFYCLRNLRFPSWYTGRSPLRIPSESLSEDQYNLLQSQSVVSHLKILNIYISTLLHTGDIYPII